MTATVEINQVTVCKLTDILKEGLCNGKGAGKAPGDMCVQQAVALVFDGNGHTDNPTCVDPVLRRFVIRLNDSRWSTPQARAAGLKRLSIAQLGTKDNFDQKLFVEKMVSFAVRTKLPQALIALGKVFPKQAEKLSEHASECEKAETFKQMHEAARSARETTFSIRSVAAAAAYADAVAAAAAYADAVAAAAAYAAAYADADAAAYAAAAAAAARDKSLAETAEFAVQVLIEMKTPGSEFLDLTC